MQTSSVSPRWLVPRESGKLGAVKRQIEYRPGKTGFQLFGYTARREAFGNMVKKQTHLHSSINVKGPKINIMKGIWIEKRICNAWGWNNSLAGGRHYNERWKNGWRIRPFGNAALSEQYHNIDYVKKWFGMRAYVQVPFVAVRKGQTNSGCPFLFWILECLFSNQKPYSIKETYEGE